MYHVFAYKTFASLLIACTLNLSVSTGNPSFGKRDNRGAFEITYASEDGYRYQLQESIDLKDWTNLGEPILGENILQRTIILEAASHKFYRFLQTIDYGTPETWMGHPIASNRISPDSLSNEASEYYTIVAAKAFAYFTGTLEQAYHEPVGEVANYFGYAALRGEIRERGGPQADEGIRGVSWMETLEILNADQRQVLYNLIEVHEPLFDEFFDIRLDLVDELWAARNGSDLDLAHALSVGLQMGRNEAELTVTSAEAYSQILPSLSTEQLQAFQNIRNGVTSIDDMQADSPNTAIVETEIANLNNTQEEVLLAIASKMISWITGTVDDAVILPPGKISNYFGFAYYRYVDRANVSRSDAANKFLSVLDDTQLSIIAGLAEDIVTPSNDYIDGREALIRGYYPLRFGSEIDHETLVEAYANRAGLGETKRAILEALTFQELEKTITPAQLGELASYRIDTAE